MTLPRPRRRTHWRGAALGLMCAPFAPSVVCATACVYELPGASGATPRRTLRVRTATHSGSSSPPQPRAVDKTKEPPSTTYASLRGIGPAKRAQIPPTAPTRATVR